jgi:hypothetical protein
VGAKLPSSAMTLTPRGGWGSCCPRGNEAGAPRWGRNFCFINLFVAAAGEPSYSHWQRRFSHEGGGAAAAFATAKPGLVVGGAIFVL